jgi:uncharacterized protein (DUF1786 family)
MALYRVRPGFVHGLKNEYKAGDTLDLDPRAARGFADKLELVEVEPTPVSEQPPAPPAEVAPVVETQPFDVTGSTVAVVLDAVKAGKITAADALSIETANRNRATLIKALQELIDGAGSE